MQTRREHHGDVFVNHMKWLCADKDSPEVIAYLEAENDYTERTTAHLGIMAKIFHEIKRVPRKNRLISKADATWQLRYYAQL